MLRPSLVVLLAFVFLNAPGCSSGFRSSREVTTSTPASTGATVVIESRNGNVDVVFDESASTIELTAKLTCAGETQVEADERVQAASVMIESDDSQATIRPVFPGKVRGGDGANLEVTMPLSETLGIETGNGRVQVTGGTGAVTIHTSNGAIAITDFLGRVDASTSNGRITATNVGTDAKTSLRTSNGNIEATLSDDASGPATLDTSNGSVSLAVGSAFSGRVSMSTSNGKVTLHDPAGRATSSQIHKSEGSVTVGAENHSSTLSTSNGSVTLELRAP